MKKSQKASLALGLALLAGCVSPKEKIVERQPAPVVYGPFRSATEELIAMLGDSVIRREISEEELKNCRGSPNPRNYRQENLYQVVRSHLYRR